jgi:hypothetical protein
MSKKFIGRSSRRSIQPRIRLLLAGNAPKLRGRGLA